MVNQYFKLFLFLSSIALLSACTQAGSSSSCSGGQTNVCLHSFKNEIVIGTFSGKNTPDTIFPNIPKCINLETAEYIGFSTQGGARFIWKSSSCEENLPLF